MIRMFSQVLAGGLFVALAGSAAAQMYGGGYLQDVADTKVVPTQAGGDTTPPPTPPEAKSTKSKASTSHSASKSSSHHAHAKTASHKKATAHAAKSTTKSSSHAASTHASKSTTKATKASAEPALAPEENAYRQALRGCATQQNQAQRDSCIDSAIEKYQRNT